MITTDTLTSLIKIAGSDNCITDVEILSNYGKDYTEDLLFIPELVIFGKDSLQISAILSFCNAQSIPVYTRGAGTGLSGACLPVKGGIVLSTEKMNRIIEIDSNNFMATVEPGVINDNLRNEVEKIGLFYPPDPASKGSCTIGGNVAHSSGGPKAVKYGTTKEYILNIEMVLPNGEIIWTGANTVKNSTGFNLTQLIVGSEGLLGVITKVVLKLIALPKKKILLLALFANAKNAAECVNAILLSGILPSALELMDIKGTEISSKMLNIDFPKTDNTKYYLLIELDGDENTNFEIQCESIFETAQHYNLIDMLQADTADQMEKWWKVRRSIGELVKQKSIYKEEDTVVPRAYIPLVLKKVENLETQYGFEAVCYGHAGDGNLHINILKNNLTDETWNKNIPKAATELFELCHSLGGTISGEHGIGLVQKQYLSIVFGASHFELFKGIKKVFDPNNILNPGKWIE